MSVLMHYQPSERGYSLKFSPNASRIENHLSRFLNDDIQQLWIGHCRRRSLCSGPYSIHFFDFKKVLLSKMFLGREFEKMLRSIILH